jgi:hypothetical protein
MTPTIYRIVTATGETHAVTVTPDAQGGYLRLTADGKRGELFSAKNNVTACVAWYAGDVGNWPVAEIVPPGGETRAELAARVRRETLAEAKAAIEEHDDAHHPWFFADIVGALPGAQS